MTKQCQTLPARNRKGDERLKLLSLGQPDRAGEVPGRDDLRVVRAAELGEKWVVRGRRRGQPETGGVKPAYAGPYGRRVRRFAEWPLLRTGLTEPGYNPAPPLKR